MAIKNIEGLVKTGNEDVMKEVKNLFEKKDEVIEGLSKKLENSIEIIKGLVDYLETIDKQLANTIVKS